MKRTSRITLLLLMLGLWANLASAQDASAVLKAFSTSYQLETSKQYAKGIETLKAVYSASSYPINLRLGWLCYLNAKHAEAITYYQKAIDLNPGSVEARYGLASPLAALERWDEVLKVYQAILAINKMETTINYSVGLIYYNRKNFAEAKKYFDVFLSQYPFNYDAVIMSAWTLFSLGKKPEAHELFTRALLLSPADPSALEGLTLTN